MKIVDKQYTRGLYCHAVSKVVVRLPGPGKSFSAIVGVDSNEQTSGGRGSVVFAVKVNGKEAFRSPLMREGMAGVPVNVPLDGASEFTLEVGDGGDGISCDQSDWADAKVVLADGRELWLGDLPLLGKAREPYSAQPPFSFKYGGRPSSEFLGQWKLEREAKKLDAQREQHTLTWTDPQSGLRVRCVGVQYRDYPTVEWTVYFQNTGTADSPMIEDIRAIDTTFSSGAQGECILRHHTGDLCTADSYQPHADASCRPQREEVRQHRRPAHAIGVSVLQPRLARRRGHRGVELGGPVGGAVQPRRQQRRARLRRAGADPFPAPPGRGGARPAGRPAVLPGRLAAGPEHLAALDARAQPAPAAWQARRTPQLAACSSHQFGEMIHANAANQIQFIDRYREEKLGLDYWWMDAGWYWNKTGWPNTGTWEVDTNRFPGGLRPISDHAHAGGQKIIVWFEPERVTAGTWLCGRSTRSGCSARRRRCSTSATPRPAQWLTDHVDKTAHRAGHRPLPAGLQHGPAALLAAQRRPGPPGHHRDPPRHRLLRLLGRAAAGRIRTC